MKPMLPIPSSKEEKSQLVPVCNQGEFIVEPKEIKQGVALEEVSTIAEIPKEVDKLHECKGVGTNKLEVLPSMEDNHHHGTIIFHDFKDPFLQKENAQDNSSKFFELISHTISTWVQCVPQDMSNSISNRTLKDLLRSKSMNYESMVYVYDWMMEEHQPIGNDYQPILDDEYIEDLMT